MMLPQNVELCVDSTTSLCSANSNATAKFCSLHDSVTVNGTQIPYVVLPWVINTSCDEPNLPTLPPNPTPAQVEGDAGSRLVGPLSQGMIDADVNPYLNSWYAQDGSEMADNAYASAGRCTGAGPTVDTSRAASRHWARW